jgi:hypothetical protein
MNKNIMLFSKRAKLAEEYEKWVNQPLADGAKIKDCPLSVITFMVSKGFVQIPEGSVVLSKEEYELLKSLEESYEHLEKTKDDLLSERSMLALQFARARKETAKEIIEEIKSLLFPEEAGLLAWLVAIADKYGVEVEE